MCLSGQDLPKPRECLTEIHFIRFLCTSPTKSDKISPRTHIIVLSWDIVVREHIQLLQGNGEGWHVEVSPETFQIGNCNKRQFVVVQGLRQNLCSSSLAL